MDGILYDELLEAVLCRLNYYSFIFSPSTADVCLVSKRWLRLYRSSKSRLSLRLSPDNCSPPSLSSFLSHFPHLSFLNIIIHPFGNATDFADQILLAVAASSCPKLTTLCLRGQPVSLSSSLLSLSTSCPRLASLTIALSRPLSFHWLLSFHSLRSLAVFPHQPPVPSQFEPLDAASQLPIEILNSDSELPIEILLLCGIQRGDYGFDWLWRSCKNLKKLDLRRCQGIGDDTSVSSFVNCFKGLQEVQLRGCASILNDILSRLVENCTSLNSLLIKIGHDSKGGGSREGLLQFFTHSRCNLRKLNLFLPFDIENNHLLAMAVKFRGLSCLQLDTCINVTGEVLKIVALALSNELEELALINCNVEPELLITIGQRFRNLRKLDLSFNAALEDEQFISMLMSCNCLRDLTVSGCPRLTNTSVISIFKSCKQLESIDIMKCGMIEPEAVELLVLNCMELRVIRVEESKLSDVSRLWASKKFVRLFVK